MAAKLSTEEREYLQKTKLILQSKEYKQILARLRELKSMGRAEILPLVLDILTRKDEKEEVRTEIIQMLCDLKDQECAPVVATYIDEKDLGENKAPVLSSCWQSRLDYSAYLPIFVNSFIDGTYQEAIEAFTVIEEMLWRATNEMIGDSKKLLLSRDKEVQEEKKPLLRELVKLLNNGQSQNREDYPELYPS